MGNILRNKIMLMNNNLYFIYIYICLNTENMRISVIDYDHSE